VNVNKEQEVNIKKEKVLDKEFKNNKKLEKIEIKKYENNLKLNETKSKLGQKIKVESIDVLDNTKKLGKFLRFLIVIFVLILIISIGFLILKYTNLLDKFNNLEEVKNFILSGGNFSLIIFVVLQFLQVTFLPIPAFITTVAGALVFGPWKSFILSFIAIMLGSFFAFYLGRKFGKKILVWIAGQEDANKWTRKLTNGKYAFFLMMLFPAFPDDLLCIAAGVTNMTFKFFTITNLITRPIGIICICFLGSGTLIPYSGWGLIVWPILLVLLVVLFILSIKYQDKIEKFVDNLSSKLSRNKIKKQNSKEIDNLNVGDN